MVRNIGLPVFSTLSRNQFGKRCNVYAILLCSEMAPATPSSICSLKKYIKSCETEIQGNRELIVAIMEVVPE